MKKLTAFILINCLLLISIPTCFAENTSSAELSPIILNAITVSASDQTPSNIQGIIIDGVPSLNRPKMIAELNHLIGKPITRESLQYLLAVVNAQIAASGEQFSVASLPEQDISTGRLKVLITRARVGEISVKNSGEGAFSDDRYRSLLRIKPGDVLVNDTLDEEIDWINRSNPYRNAQVMTQPGKQIGQTDLELLVTDRRPYGFSVGYDNNGTRVTGRDRFTFTAGWGNVFGLDQQLSYTLNANQNFNKYLSHTLNYVIPLPWHHLLSFSANASHVHPELPSLFSQHGTSSGFSARYDVLLKKVGAYTHEANVGFDYKRSDNNLLFSQTPVTNTLTKIYQFNLGYSGSLQDRLGQTTMNANWVHSPGNFGDGNTNVAFNASRSGATADYNYWQLGLERITHLPRGWNWKIKSNLQFADSNLLGSEQLSGGGVNSVRGFAEAIVFGDEGCVLRSELQAPAKPLGARTNLTGILFYDAAWLSNVHRLSGEAKINRLSSIGLGMRLAMPYQISARLDVAKQLTVDVPGSQARYLVHVGVNASF